MQRKSFLAVVPLAADLEAPRVFGIGFHKTGTTTLARALDLLGFSVGVGARPARELLGHRHMIELLHARDFDPLLNVAAGYRACVDSPWCVLFRELDHRFPGSKFILTVREEQRWLASALRYFRDSESDLRAWMYGVATPAGNEQRFVERYQRHNADVAAHFTARPQDLLTVDWEQAADWMELSSFLGRAAPSAPFPHENQTGSL